MRATIGLGQELLEESPPLLEAMITKRSQGVKACHGRKSRNSAIPAFSMYAVASDDV
jgi:hypothetical protein